MSDPIDEGLTTLEQHAPGFLQGAVHTLREGWEFVVDSFPDPTVIRTQGHNLSSLHDRGKTLYDQYNQSLLTLRDTWQGDLADTYLPPAVTGFQVEHGTEPTDSSASTPLELYFRNVVDALDHNSGTHQTWASQFDMVRGKQTEARVTIGGTVTLAAAGLFLPGVGEAADAGELTGAAFIIGGILNTVRQIWQDYKIIIIIVGVAGAAAATAVAVDELVKPAPHIGTKPGGGTGTGGGSDPTPDWNKIAIGIAIALGVTATALATLYFIHLSQEQQDDLVQELAQDYGCDAAAIRALLNKHPNLTVKQITQLLEAMKVQSQNQAFLQELQQAYQTANPKPGSLLDNSYQKMMREIQTQIDKMTTLENQIINQQISDKLLNTALQSAQNTLQGKWAEWKVAQYYGDKTLFFNTDQGSTEIDVAIRDGNGIKFIQIKDYASSFGINPGGDPNQLSAKWTALADQVKATQDLTINPQILQELHNQYDWFDGNINVEVDLINNKPLNPNTPGWQNVADKLHTDPSLNNGYPNDVNVQSTDPNQKGSQPYDPKNPLHDGNFQKSITDLPPIAGDWCSDTTSTPTPGPSPVPTPTP